MKMMFSCSPSVKQDNINIIYSDLWWQLISTGHGNGVQAKPKSRVYKTHSTQSSFKLLTAAELITE